MIFPVGSERAKSTDDAEGYSEPCQKFKTELFAKTFNGSKPLTISAKLSILHVHGSSPPPPPLPILGGDLKISDQNKWGGPEQKIKFGGKLNLRGDLRFCL